MLNCDLALLKEKDYFFPGGELLCKVGVFESNKLVYITNGNLGDLEIFIEIIAEFSFNFCRVRTVKTKDTH